MGLLLAYRSAPLLSAEDPVGGLDRDYPVHDEMLSL